jgi:hypothetical protein
VEEEAKGGKTSQDARGGSKRHTYAQKESRRHAKDAEGENVRRRARSSKWGDTSGVDPREQLEEEEMSSKLTNRWCNE